MYRTKLLIVAIAVIIGAVLSVVDAGAKARPNLCPNWAMEIGATGRDDGDDDVAMHMRGCEYYAEHDAWGIIKTECGLLAYHLTFEGYNGFDRYMMMRFYGCWYAEDGGPMER